MDIILSEKREYLGYNKQTLVSHSSTSEFNASVPSSTPLRLQTLPTVSPEFNASELSVNQLRLQDKKKSRKIKKQSEKELMNDYYSEFEIENSLLNKKKIYENIQYLSTKERKNFDSKFTKPINFNQEEYVNTLQNVDKKIIIVSGPAGTGKTLFATEFGIKNFLLGIYEKLIFTRPSVTVDEELGYLPGTLEQKIEPYIRPIYDILYKFMTPNEVKQLLEDKIIEIAPLGYMRGRTFKNCWIVADEMQNSTISQMKMLLTRIGENTKMVITGDLEQHDRGEEINGLEDFLSKFKGKRSHSIQDIEFDKNDIQREDVIKEVLDIYSSSIIPLTYIEK